MAKTWTWWVYCAQINSVNRFLFIIITKRPPSTRLIFHLAPRSVGYLVLLVCRKVDVTKFKKSKSSIVCHPWLCGGRRSPAVACWVSDHWVASSLVWTHSGANVHKSGLKHHHFISIISSMAVSNVYLSQTFGATLQLVQPGLVDCHCCRCNTL